MKIRFVTPYFPPEVGAPQTRIYELATRLVKLGHEVTVVTTFPNYPTGVVPDEWRGKLWWKGCQDGIQIWRFWCYTAPNRGFARRLATHLSFCVSSAIGGAVLPACDVLIVESPPLFDGFAALFLSAVRRTPYMFMVSDLWPESAVQMGMLRNRFLIRASKWIELLFYRRAKLVLALTRGICENIIEDGIPSSKVQLFRNSVDCDFFRPGIDGSAIRRQLNIRNDEYVVLYAGTLGLAQGLSSIIKAASLCQNEAHVSIRFVLVGNGAEADDLAREIKALGLANILLASSFPKSQMPEMLNAADCILVPLRDLEIFRGALPTKMFEGMACGKPIVLAVRGEAEELISRAEAGICATPEDPDSIRAAVLTLAADPQLARHMGENGRRVVSEQFSREIRARELAEYVSHIVTPEASSAHRVSASGFKSLFARTPHR